MGSTLPCCGFAPPLGGGTQDRNFTLSSCQACQYSHFLQHPSTKQPQFLPSSAGEVSKPPSVLHLPLLFAPPVQDTGFSWTPHQYRDHADSVLPQCCACDPRRSPSPSCQLLSRCPTASSGSRFATLLAELCCPFPSLDKPFLCHRITAQLRWKGPHCPNPLLKRLHQSRLPRTVPSQPVLSISKAGDFLTSPGNLCQALTTLLT